MDIKKTTNVELLAFYNKHCGELNLARIEKFESRKDAVQKVTDMVDLLGDEKSAPKKKTKEPKAPVTNEQLRANISAGVVETWKDPVVAAKRKERHAVMINGTDMFQSVLAAYIGLNLNPKDHIKFRKGLKLEPIGTSVKHLGAQWTLIPFADYQEAASAQKAADREKADAEVAV